MSKEPKRVCKNCRSWIWDSSWLVKDGLCTDSHFSTSNILIEDDDNCYPSLPGEDAVSLCFGPLFGCRFFKKKGVANAVEIPTIPDNG